MRNVFIWTGTFASDWPRITVVSRYMVEKKKEKRIKCVFPTSNEVVLCWQIRLGHINTTF